MSHHHYFLSFETDKLFLKVFINKIPIACAVGKKGMSHTIRVDQWLKPGYNIVSLQFNHVKGAARRDEMSKDIILARGNLYSVDPKKCDAAGNSEVDDRNIVARFKWSNNSRRILLPFNDQFEIDVDDEYCTNIYLDAEEIRFLDTEDKKEIIRLVNDYLSIIAKPRRNDTDKYKLPLYNIHLQGQSKGEEVELPIVNEPQQKAVSLLDDLNMRHARFFSGLDEKLVAVTSSELEQAVLKSPEILPLMPITTAKINGVWVLVA